MGSNTSSAGRTGEFVALLLQRDIPFSDLQFWHALFSLPESLDDVHEHFAFSVIRAIKKKAPYNLRTLFEQCLFQMNHAITVAEKPDATAESFPHLKNVVRILTRVLSVVLEDARDPVVEDVMWQPVTLPESKDAAKDASSAGQAPQQEEPLAKQLVFALTQLLFLPHFTVHKQPAKIENNVHLHKLWTSSLAQSNAHMDENRADVVRCLIVCFSEGVFVAPDLYKHGQNRWLAAVSSKEHELAPTLFYSLLNTVCGYDPVGTLPYSYMLFTDFRKPLVDVAVQLLLILLDHRDMQHLAASAPVAAMAPGQAVPRPQEETIENVFRDCFLSIRKEDDLAVIYDGLTRLLNTSHQALSTSLPNSMTSVECFQEIFVLVWKLLDENQHFYEYAVHRADITKLLLPTLYCMYEYRQDAGKIGLMYTNVFILLRLSGDREFSVALNRDFTEYLPTEIPKFKGTFADLLIIVCHKLIVTCPDQLDALLNVVLTVLSNVSPYISRLDLVSSVKLLNLFELFSSPKFLYANESNHQYVFLLLDIFNNIIQYQYQGNSRLVYAITRRAHLFYRLGRMSNPDDPKQTEVNSELTEQKVEESKEVETQPDVWLPTREWALAWKRKLPLEPIFRLLEFFLPKMEALILTEQQVDDSQFLELLTRTTLVGVLPVPHSIVVRRYIPNTYTNLWFTSYIWGVIFIRNQRFALFDPSAIKMFAVSVSAAPGSDVPPPEQPRPEEDSQASTVTPATPAAPAPASPEPADAKHLESPEPVADTEADRETTAPPPAVQSPESDNPTSADSAPVESNEQTEEVVSEEAVHTDT